MTELSFSQPLMLFLSRKNFQVLGLAVCVWWVWTRKSLFALSPLFIPQLKYFKPVMLAEIFTLNDGNFRVFDDFEWRTDCIGLTLMLYSCSRWSPISFVKAGTICTRTFLPFFSPLFSLHPVCSEVLPLLFNFHIYIDFYFTLAYFSRAFCPIIS